MKLRSALVGCLLVSMLIFVNTRPTTLASPRPDAPFETRCGWFQNPTPANIWLDDRDGEWIIGEQGGYQVDGDWPEFNARNWVKTNGSYGYGCACFDLQVDVPSHHVLAIRRAAAKPLQTCRRDSALSKWMKMLR